jgi:hypothetical protein
MEDQKILFCNTCNSSTGPNTGNVYDDGIVIKYITPVGKVKVKSQDSPVSIATDYGLDDQMIRVQILAGAGNFSLQHCVQTASEAHSASYPVGTRGCFPGDKTAGV